MTTERLAPNRNDKALQRLDTLVSHLVKLHTRQFYVRHLLVAVFWGLLVASVAVIVVRLSGLSYPLWWASVLPVAFACLVAVVIAWRGQPDNLTVAIAADQKLKLKQRLSTAWEFRQSQPDTSVTHALAFQAAGRRLPTVAGVFPFELNLAGMLIPVALAVLVLSGMIDLNRIEPGTMVEVDRLLIDEGSRLKAFARRMQLRATQKNYARSEAIASKLHRLGSSMEAGAVQRKQALVRLDMMEREIVTQRSQALGEASATGPNSAASGLATKLQNLGLAEMHNRLSAGELLSDDVQALDDAAGELASLGISAGELRQALDQYTAGQSQQLQRILEKLAGAEKNLGDASELSKARAAVAQSHKNLSDNALNERSVLIRDEGMLSEQGSAEEGGPDGFGTGEFPGQHDAEGGGWNKFVSPDNSPDKQKHDGQGLSDDAQVTLGVKGQKDEGGSFKSSTWALPRTGEATGQALTVDMRFKKQMEAVLNKETYPLHRKELIRRYFLNLSTGTQQEVNPGVSK